MGTKMYLDNNAHRFPKISLHDHLNWSLPPAYVAQLMAEQGRELPRGLHDPAKEYFIYADINDFFQKHELVRPFITSKPEYYGRHIRAFGEFLASKGVIYNEFMFSTQLHPGQTDFYPRQIAAMTEAIEEVETRHGLIMRGILNGIRHRPIAELDFMLTQAQKHSAPWVVGFGLSGNERDHPPELFTNIFARAHGELGLQCTIHSGEMLGADSIRRAIDLPGIKRIGHGIRCTEDPGLMDRIRDRGITLEICPTSNLSFFPEYRDPAQTGDKQFKHYVAHPVRQIMNHGIRVALGADDGPWYRTSISREYRRVALSFGWGASEMQRFTLNGIDGSFADQATKDRVLKAHQNGMEKYYREIRTTLEPSRVTQRA